MSAPDPERLARILADPAFAALCRVPWLPDPCNAPQVQAYTSPADLLLYGGAAGGGKTDLLLGLALTAHERAVIFRRAYADLDGLEQRLIEILRQPPRLQRDRHGAAARWAACSSSARWKGPAPNSPGRAGRTTSSASTRARSSPRTRCASSMGWLRSTTPDQRCRVVIASNPPIGGAGRMAADAGSRRGSTRRSRIRPQPGELRWRCMRADGTIAWVDGPGTHVIDGVPLEAMSCTFIPARLDDNRFLRDTDYRSAADEPAGAAALQAAERRFPRRPRGRGEPGHPVGLDRGGAEALDAGRRRAASR